MIQKKLKIYHSISTMNSLDGGLSKAVLGMVDNPKKYMSIISKKKILIFLIYQKNLRVRKFYKTKSHFFFQKN